MSSFDRLRWSAIAYLGVFGGAVGFFLWSYALAKSTPTLVALSVTVNPIAAALVGWVALNEPVGPGLVAGLVLVFLGIVIATTRSVPRLPPEVAE